MERSIFKSMDRAFYFYIPSYLFMINGITVLRVKP